MIKIEQYIAHEKDNEGLINLHTIKRIKFCGIPVWAKATQDYTPFNPDGSIIQEIKRPVGFQCAGTQLIKIHD